MQGKSGKNIVTESTTRKFLQRHNSLITYLWKFPHISLRGKRLLYEAYSLRTKILTKKLLKFAENENEFFFNCNMQIWQYEKRSDNDSMGKRSKWKKKKLNWKWYKLRSIPFILLLLLIVVVRSPIQLVSAKLKSVNNGYCDTNSGWY